MITVNTFLGGQFALSVATPRSSAPLRSAARCGVFTAIAAADSASSSSYISEIK